MDDEITIAMRIGFPDKSRQASIHDPGNVAVPITENVCNEILSLPVSPYIPPAHIEHIAKSVREFDRNGS